MNFRTLRYFASVCDCGGIGRAARQLSVAQSTVSSAIADLEEEFRETLLEPTLIGLRPSAAGLRLRQFTESLLLDVELACQEIANRRLAPTPTLSVNFASVAEGTLVRRVVVDAIAAQAAGPAGHRVRLSSQLASTQDGASASSIVVGYKAGNVPSQFKIGDRWHLLRLREERPGPVPRSLRDLAGLRIVAPDLDKALQAQLVAALGGIHPLFVDLEEAGSAFTLLAHKECVLLLPSGLLPSGGTSRSLESYELEPGPANPVLVLEQRNLAKAGNSLLEGLAKALAAVLPGRGEPTVAQPRFWQQHRLDYHTLRCFTTVVETGSITRAAASCNIVQPALSMQIRKLETALGSKLLGRPGNGIVVEPAGHRFYDLVQPLLQDTAAHAAILRAGSVKAAIARVGLLPALNEDSLLAEAMAETIAVWRDGHPGFGLSVAEGYSDQLKRWLRNHLLDAAIIDNTDPEVGLRIEPLLAEPLSLIHAPGVYQLPRGGGVDVALVRNMDLVMPSQRFGLRSLVDRTLESHGPAIVPSMEIDSLAAIVRLVRMGRWVTILPASALKRDLRDGRLLANPLRNPEIVRRLGLARRQRSQLPEGTSDFVRALLENIRGIAPAVETISGGVGLGGGRMPPPIQT